MVVVWCGVVWCVSPDSNGNADHNNYNSYKGIMNSVYHPTYIIINNSAFLFLQLLLLLLSLPCHNNYQNYNHKYNQNHNHNQNKNKNNNMHMYIDNKKTKEQLPQSSIIPVVVLSMDSFVFALLYASSFLPKE